MLKGAEAIISSSTLSGNGAAGLLASEFATATLSDSEARSNAQHGVVAQAGASITCRMCLVKLNGGAGILSAQVRALYLLY